MGRAFEYRKATKLKRWGHMARTFTKIGKQIAIAVKAGGPDPDNNPHLRSIILNAKRENMPLENVKRAIKNAMGKDQSDYKEVTYEGYGPHGIAIFVDAATDNTRRTVGLSLIHLSAPPRRYALSSDVFCLKKKKRCRRNRLKQHPARVFLRKIFSNEALLKAHY